ncbi:MAG: DUF924 family protein [Ottowia sp.]|uniref:DUF924 family protein n=1 Tax=unclassified Ottowia TaxID=2645081 RepID=UPI003C2FE7E8
MTPSPVKFEEVLNFWFGACPPTDIAAQQVQSQWFTKSDAFDAEVRERFGATIEAARKGDLDGWAKEPLGWLALLIVLDQFTRNVYRGRPESFSGDAAALRWAEHGRAQGWDHHVPLMARAFTYLPLEHSEDLARQDRSVEAFQALLADAESVGAQGSMQDTLRSYLDYAERHRDVIRRFGRFPHRNAILGRSSTQAESEYLAQPGAGF